MNTPYEKLYIKDLNLFVINGLFDMDAYKKQKLELQNYKIIAAIIGKSHFVAIEAFGVKFSEILACVEIDCEPLAKVEIINSEFFETTISNAKYFFKRSIIPFSPSLDHLKKERKLQTIFLFHDFEKEKESDKITPRTELFLEVCGNMIKWETIHVYDTDKKIVRTESFLSAI